MQPLSPHLLLFKDQTQQWSAASPTMQSTRAGMTRAKRCLPVWPMGRGMRVGTLARVYVLHDLVLYLDSVMPPQSIMLITDFAVDGRSSE